MTDASGRNPRPASPFVRLWRTLTDAPAAVSDPERRRRFRLLSGLLVVLLVLGSLLTVVEWLLVADSARIIRVIVAGLVLLVLAYGLARRGHYRLPVILAITVTILVCLGAIIASPGEAIIYGFLTIGLILAALLLGERGLLVTAAASLAGVMLVLPAWGVPPPDGDPVAAPMLLVIVTALLLLSLRHRRALEHDRAAELVANEARFRQLFHASPLIMGLSRLADGRYLDVNPAFEHWSGWQRDEVVGRTSLELNIWVTPAEREHTVRQLGQNGLLRNLELQHRLRSGEIRDVLSSAEILTLGGERCALVTVVDITDRKRIEAALAASEARFRLLVETGSDVFMLHNPDGSARYVSPSAAHVFGYAPAALLGPAGLELLHPDDRSRLDAEFARVAADPAHVGTVEYRLRQPDGAWRWYEGVARNMLADPAIGAIVTASRDISAHKRDEQVLALHNRLLRTSAAVNDMLMRDSDEATLLAQACRILVEQDNFRMAWIGLTEDGRVRPVAEAGFDEGYLATADIRCDDSAQGRGPTGSAIRENVTVINDDTETNARFAPWRERARAQGYRSSAASPLRRHGQVIGALSVYSAVPHAFGPAEVVLLEKLAADIGFALERLADARERQRAEQALRESEANLRALADNANDGFLVNLDGRHVFANRRLTEMLGYPDNGLIGTRTEDIVHPDCLEMVRERFTRRLAGETLPKQYDMDFIARDGERVPAEVTASLTTWQGRPAGLVIVRDMRERRHAEQVMRESEERLRKVFEASAACISITRLADGVFLQVNRAWEELTGWVREEMLGRSSRELNLWVTPQAREEMLARLTQASGSLRDIEWQMRARDGLVRDMLGSIETIRFGDSDCLLIVSQDITARKRAEAQMRKLSSALEQAADAVMITDREGSIEYVNPAFEKTTGYASAEVLGQKPRLLKSGRQGMSFYQRLWSTILRGDVFADVFVNRRKDGSLYFEEKTITPLKDGHGVTTHFIATGKDVSERVQIQERLEHMAQHDALTDLPNRALLLDRLKHALARARWHSRIVAVLFVDLDRFKNINDSLGHEAGDRLLQRLAERFSRCVREGDTVARFGGDEFVILLDDVASANDIGTVAQKALEALAPPFEIDGQRLYITASIGVSLFPNDGDDANTLLKNADVAMYRAKERGKNTWQMYSADMSARAFERLSLETSLRHALERGEFRLYYQPQVDAATGEVPGVEALLRWQHPDFGLVSPADFVPLLEETGLIVPVGEWVLRTACAQLREWRAAGWELRMAVNLSPRQFHAQGLVQTVQQILATSDCEAASLELEITESAIMQHEAATHDTFDGLRALGVRMAIDDFGTGYSSLSYLRRFPVDTLKIDRAFVHDVPDDADDSAIAAAIIVLGQSLKLEVIAEGVENEAQREFLQARGCQRMQGYLYSRPLPAEELAPLLAQRAKRVG